MSFSVNEMAILNEKAIKGLPNRTGERVKVVLTKDEYTSPNFDYVIEFDDETTTSVRETELNKLTEEDKRYMEYIFIGNKVVYHYHIVDIVKVDYLHRKAEVKFPDGEMLVIDFEKLRMFEEESNTPETKTNFKFNIGDKVKSNTKDQYTGLVGTIIERHDKGDYLSYMLDLGEKWCPFVESELEFAEQNEGEIMVEKSIHEELIDAFLGHYKNKDNTYTLPKELLVNILKHSYAGVE